MFHITILAIGKLKAKYFQAAAEEYAKRLKSYVKLEIVELEAESFTEDEGSRTKAKKKELERIFKFLKKHGNAEIIILEEKGKEFSSEKFAKFLDGLDRHIVFIIGGSLGWDEEIKKRPFMRLSLSQMTYPHELARVALLEQIFRAVAILRNKEYHY